MRDRILLWMREQHMTEPGDTVICAVSGGADSVCMLHILLSLRDALGITVEAAHFNHHLRGAEADRDEAFVRKLCASLDGTATAAPQEIIKSGFSLCSTFHAILVFLISALMLRFVGNTKVDRWTTSQTLTMYTQTSATAE